MGRCWFEENDFVFMCIVHQGAEEFMQCIMLICDPLYDFVFGLFIFF
jgi:hypothetical protein